MIESEVSRCTLDYHDFGARSGSVEMRHCLTAHTQAGQPPPAPCHPTNGAFVYAKSDDLVPELRSARRLRFSARCRAAGGHAAGAARVLARARAHRGARGLARRARAIAVVRLWNAAPRHGWRRLMARRSACSRSAGSFSTRSSSYDLSVAHGQFAVLQRQIAGVSRDRRIQALLIAFSFGAFIEGAAGFGAPVAISGALMIGLGFRPLEAAKLALIGNTAPVAFGALGTPLITLAKITDLDLQALSAMVGRQLPVFSIIVPFWLIAAQVGWRGMLAVWPACLVDRCQLRRGAVCRSAIFTGRGWSISSRRSSRWARSWCSMRFWTPADERVPR